MRYNSMSNKKNSISQKKIPPKNNSGTICLLFSMGYKNIGFSLNSDKIDHEWCISIYFAHKDDPHNH